MHYVISTKVLGQIHMWNTQNKRSNFLKIFQFFMGFVFFEFFEHTKKQNMKRKSTKTKAKQKLEKETC